MAEWMDNVLLINIRLIFEEGDGCDSKSTCHFALAACSPIYSHYLSSWD